MRKFRRETPRRSIPKHPYRDSAVSYAGLAGVLVGVTAPTDGAVPRAISIAGALLVSATISSWWRRSVRIRREERE